MGLLGRIGWAEAPASSVASAALDGVNYQMAALKYREYQD
jgi:hypothetical protein